jgi:hypothetical protein
VTPTGVEEQLRALAGVAVWNLAAPGGHPPAPRRLADLHVLPPRLVRTPEAAADAMLAGHHGNGSRIGLR